MEMEGAILLLLCAGLSLYMLLSIDLLSYLLRRTGWSRFLSTFLLFYAQIISTEFILGIFSILNGFTLVVINLLVSSALLIALKSRFGNDHLRNYLTTLKKSVTNFKTTLRQDPLWCILLVLAFVFILWVIFLGITFPATDFDGNSYHLTFIGNVIQNHNFFDPKTSLTWLAGYPKGGEFIQMWSVIITRNDMFSDLAQLPFLALGVYALYTVAVTLGADKKQARFSATLFIFLPIVLNQLKTTYVDIMLCSLFFAGLATIIKNRLSSLDALLIGIVFSLLISIKSTGFLFVAVLAPLLLWKLYANLGRQYKRYIKPLVLIILPMSFGLYWYIKNYVIYGSPIYPFGFKLAGHSIFPGKTFQEFAAEAVSGLPNLPKGCVDRIWFVWTEQKDWFGCLYNYDTNYAGFGPIWFILLIPGLLMSLYFAIRKRAALFLAVFATVIALFAIYPSNYYSRYTMFVTSLGIFGLSITLSTIHKNIANVVKSLALVLVVSVIGTNFVLCNYSPEVVKNQIKSIYHGSGRGAIYGNMPGHAFVYMEETVRAGDVVAYDSKPYFIYPLWKTDFSDKVIYVPATSAADWYNGLRKESVDYVFTVVYSRENPWAKAGGMTSIYKDEMYEIFKVN